MSYTNFEYADLKIDESNPLQVKVSVTIKNTGKLKGEEVAQLYIRDIVASIVRPVIELKGFQKFMLNPGESKLVEFMLTDAELGFYTNTGEFIVEPGGFEVMVGTNSQIGLKGKFIKQ